MITKAALASFIASLFSMMNPIGNVGVFAGMTAQKPAAEARRIAWTCAFAVAITLLIVTWCGPALFKFFGVTVHSLRSAGGVIVLVIGLHMLFNKSEHNQTATELEDAEKQDSIAFVPLAIPMVAGPGSMAAVLVAAQQHHSVLNKIEISVVVFCLAALCGVLFSFATPIAKLLGIAGMGVVTRIMGLVLSAIAMGMLTEGLKALLPGLAG
jgi:multiple antibiotic resistance protein